MRSARTDPLDEARARVGDGHRPRVLEPSLEDLTSDPLDPRPRSSEDPRRPPVLPVEGGWPTWSDLAADDPELQAWCADRWLAPRPLPPPLAAGGATTAGLRRLCGGLLAPAAVEAGGNGSLRWTRGGVGTPVLPGRRQVRVDGDELVVQRGPVQERSSLTTLRGARAVVGLPLREDDDERSPRSRGDPHRALPAAVLDAPLEVRADDVRIVSDWLGFATSLLAQVRADRGLQPSGPTVVPGTLDVRLVLEDGRELLAGPGDRADAAAWLRLLPGRGGTRTLVRVSDLLGRTDAREWVLGELRAVGCR